MVKGIVLYKYREGGIKMTFKKDDEVKGVKEWSGNSLITGQKYTIKDIDTNIETGLKYVVRDGSGYFWVWDWQIEKID